MLSRYLITVILMFGLASFSIAQHPPSSQPSTQPSTRPTTQAANDGGKMTFEEVFKDIGKVKRGEVREFEFPFTNTGNAPIKIDLVSSCDCTTTNYPKREIKPGEQGSIQVSFDSTEKEESETIDIDIFLTNEDPVTGAPMIVMLQYKYELLK